MGEKMEKLNLEVTVIVTEKLSLKKEYDRLDSVYQSLKRDNKELRVNYNLLVDENTEINKQNSQYRGLILENEQKLSIIDKEIKDLQRNVELKNKNIQRLNEESEVSKRQIEKLLEQLRDKSESEDFDAEKERILNVEKAMENETLK